MKLRVTALLVALPAIVAGLLVASPTEAATTYATVTTKYVAINSSGSGVVYMRCAASTTCKGSIYFVGSEVSKLAYSVPAKSARYVSVAMKTTDPAYPNSGAFIDRGDFNSKAATLQVNEAYPTNTAPHSYAVTTETRLYHQQITGQVTGPADGLASDVRVELVRTLRGGNTEVVKSASNLPNGGTYSFDVSLGTNNSDSSPFQLRVSGKDQNGQFRAWYWRGYDGDPRVGGRYLREASTVRARKWGNFDASFTYSSIYGNVTNQIVAGGSAKITVAAPPKTYLSASTRREYDLQGCANIYGETTASGGSYRVDFLPASNISDRRYMVGAKYGATQVWNNAYGSCLDTLDYGTSTANLLALGATPLAHDALVRKSNNNLFVDGRFGFSGSTSSDRRIRLREKVPGVPVLDARVIAEGPANSSGNRNFSDVPPGEYWVEFGRRTGCSAWYASRFSNNDAYFSGLDRGAERWKTVAGKYAEYQKSYDMGYVARTPPSGYKGWMYRGYCKAYGTGTINTTSLTGFDNPTLTKLTSINYRGAVVHGHVSRSGGRTNKEMMVRLSSSDGTRVIRTDLTDSSGNFYVAGLASGTWTISVNSDSWRGIGRSFSGRHTITVSRGNTYGVGTLSFSG